MSLTKSIYPHTLKLIQITTQQGPPVNISDGERVAGNFLHLKPDRLKEQDGYLTTITHFFAPIQGAKQHAIRISLIIYDHGDDSGTPGQAHLVIRLNEREAEKAGY
jgi:hypothetical protein